MALINCPECKKEISDAAKFCPHCGFQPIIRKTDVSNETKSAQQKKGITKNPNAGCASAIGVVVLIFLLIFVIGSWKDWTSSDGGQSGNVFLAYTYTEKCIKNKLKSPSTARFPSGSERKSHVQYLGNNRYEVNSWVDSQNGYGATLRLYFKCRIKIDEDGYGYTCLQVDFE